MTTEQIWAAVVSLSQQVTVLAARLDAHVKAHNAMPWKMAEVIEPMRQVETEQTWDDDWVNV